MSMSQLRQALRRAELKKRAKARANAKARAQAKRSNRPNSPPTLLSLLGHESPIRNKIWELLPPDAAIMLSRTCKTLHSLHGGLCDINHRLSRFVTDPIALRSLMGAHNALIAGSFAVQFFARLHYKEADLDIFLEKGSAVEAFDVHLRKIENYELEGTGKEKGQPYMMGSLDEVSLDC